MQIHVLKYGEYVLPISLYNIIAVRLGYHVLQEALT